MSDREKFLKANEVTKLKKLSSEAGLNSQRASALLLLHNGVTINDAAEKSGLSRGQVRYALDRFMKIGMEMFRAVPASKTTTSNSETPEKPVIEEKEETKEKKVKKDKKKDGKKKKEKEKKDKKKKKDKDKKKKDKKKKKKK